MQITQTHTHTAHASWPKNGTILLVGEFDFLNPHPKDAVAEAFLYAKTILSEHSVRSAALFDSNSHPDFQKIYPEKNSNWIKIDQIRALIEWAMGRPQISSKKVAVLYPAHALNVQAANALLKTLEESSVETLFILVTNKPSFLPATVRSRCHWIRLRETVPPEPFARLELKNELLNDLQALQRNQTDPVIVAERWMKQNPKHVLDELWGILNEQAISGAAQNQPIRSKSWWKFLDNVTAAKRSLEESNSPNLQLLMETLLIER